MSSTFLVNYVTGSQRRYMVVLSIYSGKKLVKNNTGICMFVCTTVLYAYINSVRNYVCSSIHMCELKYIVILIIVIFIYSNMTSFIGYINNAMTKHTIYFKSHMVRIWEKKPVLSNTGLFLCYNTTVSSTSGYLHQTNYHHDITEILLKVSGVKHQNPLYIYTIYFVDYLRIDVS